MEEDRRVPRRTVGRPNPWLALAVITVVGVTVSVLLISRVTHSDPGASAPQTSTDAAHFDLPALIGSGRVRLVDFRGKPLVVNFFASWCTACRGEAPGFRSVRAAVHGSVAFVAVNSMESGDGVAFARELGISDWPMARDVGGSSDSGLLEAVGGRGLPITAFYSAEGKLLTIRIGALDEATLRAELRSLYRVQLEGRAAGRRSPSPSCCKKISDAPTLVLPLSMPQRSGPDSRFESSLPSHFARA